MRTKHSRSLSTVCLSAMLLGAVSASAAVSKVICVPWQGDTTKYHTAIPGGGGRLKAVVKTDSTATHYYRWVYGDGTESAVIALSGNTWYSVEDAHVYAGSAGTPFTAQLVVADNNALAGAISDSYLVKLEDNTLDARINVAIDNGLWYTYKQGTRSDGVSGTHRTFDGSPSVYWTSAGHRVASTASAIQAFQINGSKEGGDFDQDPYAEYVYRGLKFLIMGYVNAASAPNLRSLTIGVQHSDNPDSNGNGIGIEVYDGGTGIPTYQGGQVMDALIASGTPGMSSGRDFVGTGHIATYGEIIQDMTDMYAWGQTDGGITCIQTQTGTEDLAVNGVPTSISLEMLNTQCSLGGTFELFLNGVSLGTFANDPGNSCTCSPALQSMVFNNVAALTAAWGAAGSKSLRLTYTGGAYSTRTSAKFTWGGGLERSICVRAVTGADCSTTHLCTGDYSGEGRAAFDRTVDLSNVPVYTTECSGAGSWQYSWNSGNDNSAAQWAAIGMIPAQQPPWNAVVPQWVKNYDDVWLTQSHSTENGGLWGKFGYTGLNNVDPYVDRSATTPSGMVQLSFVDKTTADPRWIRSERWMAENWSTGVGWMSNGARRNLYAMYAMVKAMRLAKPTPVVNFAYDGFDWYRGTAAKAGVAKILSDNMIANGFYNLTYWEQNPLTTAWAVVMLKPTLFAAAPVACFTAHPNPTFSDLPVSFDPSCSTHSEPGKGLANLTKFEWDWNNDGTFDETTATPVSVSHAFHCDTVPCTFPVTLKVSDDSNPPLTATFVMDIRITDPPHPPVARPKSNYWVSECDGDTLALDGSDSFDPDEGLKQAGCAGCPIDTITSWNWDLNGAPFTFVSGSGEILDLGAGFSAQFPNPGTYDIGLRVTDNTALAYPASRLGNLTDEAFSKVSVFQRGACDLTATPGCESVHLAWSSTGAADTYRIYRSLTGANADFVEVANTGSTTSAHVGATLGQSQWFRVMSIAGNTQKMSKAVFVKLTAADCVCITDLKPAAKNRLVQLTWSPQAGATCYNVYRSTSPNVALVAGNRIASCVVSSIAVYTDTTVVNNTKYYFKVTKVVAGVETCVSREVSATPALPKR